MKSNRNLSGLNVYINYHSSGPITFQLLRGPLVQLEKLLGGLFLLDEEEQLELESLTRDADQVTSLLLAFLLRSLPGQPVGRNPDTEIPQPVVIIRALLSLVVQVVATVTPVSGGLTQQNMEFGL